MKDTEVKVWIIIINYNGICDTRECVESVLKSDYCSEIVIVDNASDNDEGELLRKEYSSLIHVIKNKVNLGFAGGNNVGIRFAMRHGAEYIMLLNNDTVIHPDMIKELMVHRSMADIIAPRMFYYNKKNVIWYSGGNINKFSGNIQCQHIGKTENEVSDSLEECSFATGCCILFAAELVNEIGYLRDEYFMYCEDTEFSLRVIAAGGVIRVVPTAKLWHKVSASTGGTGNAFSLYYSSRNRLYYINEHKEYFFRTAIFCAVTSRIIRIIQYRVMGNDKWKPYYRALRDYKRGIMGRQPYE